MWETIATTLTPMLLFFGCASFDQFNLGCQSEELQHLNRHPSDIDFPPFHPMTGRILVGVVIVVPAFTVGGDGYPPAIGRMVGSFKVAIAKFVGCAIHQPSAVIDNYQSDEYTPENER